MEVIRAKRAGACYGVQRALDMANEVIEVGGRAYTLGPLIHNPQVVAELAARGAQAVDSVDDIAWSAQGVEDARGDKSAGGVEGAGGDKSAGDAKSAFCGGSSEQARGTAEASCSDGAKSPTGSCCTESEKCAPAVVIRSHGVTPQVLTAVKERGFAVVDATCPHVSRAQAAAAELAGEGCRVIVLGEAGHPEVEGLTAWAEEAGGKVDVVAAPEEIPEGLYDPVGVVAQTTQRRENLEAVVAALREAGLDPIVKNTICSATRQRQEAAAELASAVDAMVVIGGRNSSNTTRLAEVCALTCSRTFHIESTDELDSAAFAGCRRVGVTAGASTPENQIASVEAFLRML